MMLSTDGDEGENSAGKKKKKKKKKKGCKTFPLFAYNRCSLDSIHIYSIQILNLNDCNSHHCDRKFLITAAKAQTQLDLVSH